MSVRIFIGDKEVQKKDLGKYEIKSERVKQILAGKLVESKEERRDTA